MKTLLFPSLITLTLLTVGPVAQAQTTVKTKVKPATGAEVKTKAVVAEPPSDEQIDQKANALTLNMQKNLGLVPQQFDRVRAINRRSIEGVEMARVRYRDNPRKMLSVIDDISSSRLSALKDVLNAAQFDKYQRKREEKMGLPNTQGVQGNAAPGFGTE